MKHAFTPTITIMVLVTLATPACANPLQVYAYQTDGKVVVLASDQYGGRAKSAKVKLSGPDGKAVADGRTNDEGQWSCARPADGDYVVAVETDAGHKAQAKITVTPTVRAKVKFEIGGVRPVFSPDGTTLAVGRDKAVVLLDVESGKDRAVFTGHRNWVVTVAYSPDGKTLASASLDATIALWDTATGKEKHTLELSEPAKHLLFLSEGKQLACAFDDGRVYVWDLSTQKIAVTTYAWSEDGTRRGCACLWFVPATKSICTLAQESKGDKHFAAIFQYDVSTGKEQAGPDTRQRLSYPRPTWSDLSRFQGAAASPDGQTLAFRGTDRLVAVPKSIAFWDVTAAKETALDLSHISGVTAIAFSPDGKTLASTVTSYDVILWDLATGKEKLRLTGGQHPGGLYLAFSPDGTLVAVTRLGGVVDVWKIGGDAKIKPSGEKNTDGKNPQAADLKKAINKKDADAVRKLLDNLKPSVRAAVIKDYAGKESLDVSLEALLGDLKSAFGATGDKTGEKAVRPYDLYLNHALKGLEDPEGVSYQDRAIYQWIELDPDVAYPKAKAKNPKLGPFSTPGKKGAMRIFFASLGVKSKDDLLRVSTKGEPKECVEWSVRFEKAYPIFSVLSALDRTVFDNDWAN